MDESMGLRIKQRRLELGKTMEELGAAADVGKSAVNKWEKGIVENLKTSTITKIAHALDTTEIWLMFGGDIYKERVDYLSRQDSMLSIKKIEGELSADSMKRLLLYAQKLFELQNMEEKANESSQNNN